ncbi:uncharacterized protein LOC110724067 [Chenopodium quinoa]|uniref:uncharacterized protein LOC110724067 n=1 Tax=Chenopodium quinoa TaxID=63459 RepID=UPI000B78B896|nr:uncharacterized protein LOC110724067 [Chenopodium quinoa]
MEIFIKAENYLVWRVIETGDFEITATNDKQEVVSKSISDYDKEDYQKLELNALAIKYLHYGLGPHEHNRIMGCKSSKQIWDLLQVTHEGTNEVKCSKIDLLISRYERFEMQSKETIEEMFTRFNDIINELNSLGRHIPIDEQARKILRSLPQDERWRSKVTAMQEAKDFTKFNMEQLVGSLMTHELHLSSNNESSRSKSLALKAQDSEESEVDEEEMAMLVRKFKKMMNNKKFERNKKFTSSRNTTCFRCGSKDHFIKDCPVQDGEKGKTKGKEQSKESKVYKPYFTKDNVKKAMLAAWGDTDLEEEEDQPLEETAHLCLMEKTDEAAKLKELESEVWFSYNQLKHLSKENLINTVLEIQEDLKELHRSKQQSDKALVTYKENSEWVDNMKFDIQYRFFSLFDDNKNLEETIENLKQDNILLNVELSLLKLSVDTPNSEVPPPTDYPNFEKLKHDLEDLKTDKARLEGELERARKGSMTFGDNMKGDIIAIGKIGRSRSHAIDNVFLVEGLKHNLLSISQFCDKVNSVSFTSNKCRIIHNDTGNIILEGTRKGNTYIVDLNEVPNRSLTCLSVIEDDPLLWHRRFGHASFSLLDKIRSKNLLEGLPCIKFLYDKVCEACARGKQTRISFKSKKMRRTGNQLIHLRSDHGTEFENSKFDEFCTEYGIDHNFSAPRTPQQNGVVERKNRSLEDMARTMLISSRLPRNFWAEAVNTTCYILNRVSVRAITNKTPYELMKGRKPNISYFRSFGCKCFVHNNGKRNLGKFDERSDEAVFLGYASNSKAYRVYNKRTMCVEESVHIIFDETEHLVDVHDCDDDFEIGLVRKQNLDEEPASQQKQQVEIAEVTNPEANAEPEMENAPGTPLQEQTDVHNEDQNVETPEEVQTEFHEQVPTEELVNNDEEKLYPIKDFTPRP